MKYDLSRLSEELKQDMDCFENMYKDERVSEITKDIYMNKYSYAKNIYLKLITILENNSEE